MASYKSSSSDSESSVDLADFEVLSIKEDSEINILLLGETGVGKSTFINSMGNYLSLKYFHNAKKKGLVKIIPTNYMIQDKNGKFCNVQIGSKKDKNETLITGESATQQVKTYVFPIAGGHVKVRLIDTPGMGDTRGVEQDDINAKNILSYIKKLDKIHAICFLFKPTNARKTIYFNYCIYQILSLLERSALQNICFLFSHTKGSDYGPGDTLAVLTNVIKSIENSTGISIPLDTRRNIFCFDNEAFRYLGAREKNIQLDLSALDKSEASWIHSAKECWKFIRFLQKDITPYVPKKILELNFARKSIAMLSKTLAEITQLIKDNERLLERLDDNKSKELELISKMKTEKAKIIDIIQKKMSEPLLVCTAVPSCAEVYRVQGVDKWHYKNICHSCYELDDKDIRFFTAGCPDIIQCNSINKNTRLCNRCGCDFLLHMHVNFITSIQEEFQTDEDISSRISTLKSFLQTHKETEDQIKLKNAELQKEYEIILQVCVILALFIKQNAVIAVSDSYKDYIVYLIEQSQSSAASSVTTTKKNLKKLILEYDEIEKVFQLASKTQLPATLKWNFDNHDSMFQSLFGLNHFGQKIYALYHDLKQTNSKEQSVEEYVHDSYYISERDQLRNRGKSNDRRGGKYARSHSRNNHLDPRNNRPNSRNTYKDPRNNRPDSRNSHMDHRNNRPDSRNSHMDHRNNRPDSRNSHMDHRNNRPDSRNAHMDHRNNRPDSRNSHMDHSRNNRPDPRNAHMDPRNNRPDSRNAHMDPRNNRPDFGNHHNPRNNIQSKWNNYPDFRNANYNYPHTDPRYSQGFNNVPQQNPPQYNYKGQPNYPSREYYNLNVNLDSGNLNPNGNSGYYNQHQDPRMFSQQNQRNYPMTNTYQSQGSSYDRDFRQSRSENSRTEYQRQDSNSRRGRFMKHNSGKNNPRKSSVPRNGKQNKRNSSQVRKNKNKETSDSDSDSSSSSSSSSS